MRTTTTTEPERYQRAGGPDKRGSNIDREIRIHWLLGVPPLRGLPAPYGGTGKRVRCVHCGQWLNYRTVEADRIIPGGPYARWNVQPACRWCNVHRGADMDWVPPLERRGRIRIVVPKPKRVR